MNRLWIGTLISAVGVLFVVSFVAQAQTFNTIVTFDGSNGDEVTNALIEGPDGNFYGVSETNVFRITPGGNLYTVHKFCSQPNCTDGAIAYGSLLQTANGNLYGTTAYGGVNNFGEVYEITAGGQFKVLYSFCSVNSPTFCADGGFPWAGLAVGLDGDLYGTTSFGGASESHGTIFKITPAGKLTTLHVFCADGNPSCPDGSTPYSPLLLASNGKFYGTTFYGGSSWNFGIAFEMTPAGKLTPLHEFCTPTNCLDGYSPYSGLIQASDGNLYGTTYYGGTAPGQNGTIYRLSLSGNYATIYNFCSQTNCTDGINPIGGVIQGTDGNFYGTTSDGGSPFLDCPGSGFGTDCGTVFQFTQGALNVLHSFCAQSGSCPDGGVPEASLLQATDGTFYGSTSIGGGRDCFGNGSCGTLFTVSMSLGSFVKAQIDFGKVGQVVSILGNNLTDTTNVSFNGTPAQFKVMSDTYLKAQVPPGATTGTIEVTTPSGTLKSNVPFYVP
jgi:uncharacterized repeat protein (TIGR03803 family)